MILLFFFFLNFRILFIFLYSRFLLVIHFIHISVYMSIPIWEPILLITTCCADKDSKGMEMQAGCLLSFSYPNGAT